MEAQVSAVLAALAHAARGIAGYRPTMSVRLLVPALLVSTTLLVADLLRSIFPSSGIFLLLLLSVLGSATALGALSGLVTLAIGLGGATLLATFVSHPWLAQPTDVLRVVPYLFVGGLIVVVASALRAAVSRLPITGPRSAAGLVEPLTEREAEVLAMAASGLSTREISERLFVSRNTVKSHLSHAYGKLGAHNRAEAIAAGLHSGTLGPREVTSRAPEITAGLIRPQPRLHLLRGDRRAEA